MIVTLVAPAVFSQAPATPEPDVPPLADLHLPAGFSISLFASGLQGARHMVVSPSRTIRVGGDGRLYVSLGSSCNVCVEPDARRTTIQVLAKDTARLEPFAIGLRNAIGFDCDPATGRMWATDAGQDGAGSGFPPDELNLVEAGRHYGCPFFIGDNLVNDVPELKGIPPTVTAKDAVPPAFALPPHATGIDLRFSTGTQFPAAYRGAMFVTLHGSSTIPERIGYKVVRVVMKDGRPVALEDFVTGWVKDGAVTDVLLGS